MPQERKIAAVVKKLSFKEAEEADDLYWAQTSGEYRLHTLFELREMVYGDRVNQPMKKVVYKRNIYETIKDRK